MAKVFFVRHQAAGFLTDFPFAQAPTPKQFAALAAYCEVRHGTKHPKTGEAYWLGVVEVVLLGKDDAPMTGPVAVGDDSAKASASEFGVSGSGRVLNK